MPWIKAVRPEDAHGKLKDEYARIEKARGAVGDIFAVTGQHPGVPGAHLDLYGELQFGDSPLSRRERELIATVVSRANGCAYCLAHHADAFGRHAPEAGLQALVATDYTKAPLGARERAIADHAMLLTKSPGKVANADLDKLRKAGLDERAILDVTLVTAYFNFANRIASGLGLTGEDVGKHYNY